MAERAPRDQKVMIISTSYLHIGISSLSPPSFGASSKIHPQHTQEELGRSSSTSVSPGSTGPKSWAIGCKSGFKDSLHQSEKKQFPYDKMCVKYN